MSTDDDHRLAADLAAQAGQRLLALRAAGGDPDALRRDGDRSSHEFLAAELARHRPGDAVLSEEGADDRARLSAVVRPARCAPDLTAFQKYLVRDGFDERTSGTQTCIGQSPAARSALRCFSTRSVTGLRTPDWAPTDLMQDAPCSGVRPSTLPDQPSTVSPRSRGG